MITLFSGTPGSGKSYHAICIILTALGWGRMVIANFPMTFSAKQKKRGFEERFFYMSNEEITVRNLILFYVQQKFFLSNEESQCLIVIDEAGGRYNCRDFKDSDRKQWIDFFSQHRKFCFDFILVAQADRMLDRQIRGYLEYEKKHRKINHFGPFSFLPFVVFVAIEFWYTARLRTGSEFILFRQKVASQYDSMRMFSGFTLTSELLRLIEDAKEGTKEVKSKNKNSFDIPITSIFKDSDTGE